MFHGHHDLVFLGLSLAVAMLGAWTALDLFRRVEGKAGRERGIWLGSAACAMGLGIWSMHFVAMLGFDPGAPVSYDPALTLLSLVLAVGATAVAFVVAASDRAGRAPLVAAGTLMGIGICLMHYVGMAALETAVPMGYDMPLVALSLLIAIVAATAALFVARGEKGTATRIAATVALGLAVVGMHYTAMAALSLMPVGGHAMGAGAAPAYPLAFGVAGTTILILFLALMASLYDQRANILAALEAGGVGYWELDLRNCHLHISPKGKALYGLAADERLSYAEALNRIAPGSRAERERELAQAIATGADYDVEYPLLDGGRWVNARGRTMADGNGRATRMVGVVIDVTERRRALERIVVSERRQRLLVDELNHRVKNTLSTIQSLSRHMASGAPSVASFHRDLEGRILALSSTHNVLTQRGWEGADLAEILTGTLASHPPERVVLGGGSVTLDTREALAIGMVFHEMATNAARHGALAGPEGRIEVRWRLEQGADGEALHLDWHELGLASETPAPREPGLGLRIIGRSIEGELGGEARMERHPGGIRWRLRIPVRARATA
ncbi:MHYT domain-containing protein [Aureimonas jatrophae]|uniref:Blue-light-activated histidine kinase n=1 Tax=Aureimonas jatrophae TaxID=1166073 RepID=A0A1H0JZQ1_9HYPH|nr:MHYT domain-containing protein [Aureimonas jatrophae]MBB3950872.1 PAS domain S-box-containing protein [Aureimonas jatrophae]SDO48972.1 PAS domain S-box-containing protein [Aureimonas jatrophae]